MATIGIDARQALKERRGIGTCVLKLIQNIAELDNENSYILYVDRDDEKGLFPKKKNMIVKKLFPSNYILWEQIALPIQIYLDRIDVLHLAGMTGPLIYPKNIRLIATIYDVAYLKKYDFLPPSSIFYQKVGRIYRKYIISMLMNKNKKILTISEFSKQDIIGHFPEVDPGKIKVTYLSANEEFRPIDKQIAFRSIKQKFGIGSGFFLLLGGIDPRKNTEFVIDNYLAMRDSRKTDHKLVIVGIPNWKQTKFFKIVEKSAYGNDVIFTKHIPDEDLINLYNCAAVFLYPSLFEGFGIPLLEAMACGAPVVASNTSCIPEVVGDAALLINPYDSKEFVKALLTVQNDQGKRNSLIEKGFKRVAEFSWRKMSEQILEVYKEFIKAK